MVKMNIRKERYFWAGIIIALLIVVSYFVKIKVEAGLNYEVYDSILGILIFHSPIVFALYALISIVLIVKGLKRK